MTDAAIIAELSRLLEDIFDDEAWHRDLGWREQVRRILAAAKERT